MGDNFRISRKFWGKTPNDSLRQEIIALMERYRGVTPGKRFVSPIGHEDPVTFLSIASGDERSATTR